MARIRTIKPEFFTSLTIADLTPEQRLTFVGLWTHVDDEGRCVDDPRLIKAAVWPLDDRTAADVEVDLKALSESSLITRYTLNRKRYIAVTNWREHQRINRPTKSKLPAPEQGEKPDPEPPTSCDEDSRTPHGGVTEDSPQERKGTGKGKDLSLRPSDTASTTSVAEATTERETDSSRETQQPATFAQQATRATGLLDSNDEPAFLAWVADTHKPRSTGWWKTVVANDDLPDLIAEWRDQRSPNLRAVPTPLPAWCGHCGDGIPLARTNADLRKVEDARGIRRPCPNCHPTAHRKAS
jgi:hypothetical protein